ncbi:MAG: hypothetical protein RMN52_02020 [Anaerolineae bacterium]|nr:hypothetical protein [Candidatus Roseilinea sp.]MDW8448757.1 hypothetical protein [Anaerolineae bacterium]
MTHPNFPLVMALQNYMPVVLSALGLIWIAQMIRATHAAAGRLAFAGAALIILAGTLKATWKLVMSIARVDMPLLSQSLFPLIAPGFSFVAWALFVSKWVRSPNSNGAVLWLPPVLVSAAALLFALALAVTRPDRTWVFVLIGVATAANVALAVLLIHSALQRRNGLAAGLFALNLIITFALSGIAGMPNKSLEVHWVEQIISTISNAGFAWAAWMLVHPKPAALQPSPT